MGNFFNSKDLLLDGISKLKSSKIPNPEIDARILLSYAINYQNTIYMHNDISISKKNKNKFYCFLDKRIQGKPVSRIFPPSKTYIRKTHYRKKLLCTYFFQSSMRRGI